jgi:hypothetical protein
MEPAGPEYKLGLNYVSLLIYSFIWDDWKCFMGYARLEIRCGMVGPVPVLLLSTWPWHCGPIQFHPLSCEQRREKVSKVT